MDEEVQSGINYLYEEHLAECNQGDCEAIAKIETLRDILPSPIGTGYWEPGLFGKEVTLPFTYNINRCLPSQHYRLNNADLGMDTTKCPEESLNVYFSDDTTTSMFSLPFASFILYLYEYWATPDNGCNPTSFRNRNLPPTSNCQLKESYLLVITSEYPNIIVNGNQIEPVDYVGGNFIYIIYYYSGWDKSLIEKFLEGEFSDLSGVYTYNEIPSSINITYAEWEGQPNADVFLYRECCWNCNSKPSLPATILYPKVDIESFTLNDGEAIIKDGKIVSSFTIAPGVQKPIIGVENRGFFTQNNVYIKFVGLPEGIEVSTTPELQKIKAHNIGTYETTFTVGPNVPSGTYKVSLIAYSPNGILDTIIMDLVVL